MKPTRLPVAIIAVAIIAASGCGNDSPSAAASPTTAPPTAASQADLNRLPCHRLSQVANNFAAAVDAEIMRPIGQAAAIASDPAIRKIGLEMASLYAYEDPEPGNESIKAEQLTIDLADACAALYGDGPW